MREGRERSGWEDFKEAAQSRRSTWRRVDHGLELGWNNERKKNCARRGGRGSEAGAREWKMIGSGTGLNAARWFAEASGRSTTSNETRQNAQCCGWGAPSRTPSMSTMKYFVEYEGTLKCTRRKVGLGRGKVQLQLVIGNLALQVRRVCYGIMDGEATANSFRPFSINRSNANLP